MVRRQDLVFDVERKTNCKMINQNMFKVIDKNMFITYTNPNNESKYIIEIEYE